MLHTLVCVCVCVNNLAAQAMVMLMKPTVMIGDDVYQSAEANDVDGDDARTV